MKMTKMLMMNCLIDPFVQSQSSVLLSPCPSQLFVDPPNPPVRPNPLAGLQSALVVPLSSFVVPVPLIPFRLKEKDCSCRQNVRGWKGFLLKQKDLKEKEE